jgi:hypothetical protein
MVCHGHKKETVGLLNVNSIHLNTPLDGRSWSYQRNRGVVKCKLYTFKHHLRWEDVVIPVFKCIELTFSNPTVSLE